MANDKKEGAGRQGFASMDPDKQREIASEGGQSVPDEKRSFSQDRELAAEAGREGGQHSHGGNKRLVFAIFAGLAEFERELIKERTLAGLAAAKARGRLGGRRRKRRPPQGPARALVGSTTGFPFS